MKNLKLSTEHVKQKIKSANERLDFTRYESKERNLKALYFFKVKQVTSVYYLGFGFQYKIF